MASSGPYGRSDASEKQRHRILEAAEGRRQNSPCLERRQQSCSLSNSPCPEHRQQSCSLSNSPCPERRQQSCSLSNSPCPTEIKEVKPCQSSPYVTTHAELNVTQFKSYIYSRERDHFLSRGDFGDTIYGYDIEKKRRVTVIPGRALAGGQKWSIDTRAVLKELSLCSNWAEFYDWTPHRDMELLFMEFCDLGSLEDFYKRFNVTEYTTLDLMVQVSKGLRAICAVCDEQAVMGVAICCELSPRKILLSSNGRVPQPIVKLSCNTIVPVQLSNEHGLMASTALSGSTGSIQLTFDSRFHAPECVDQSVRVSNRTASWIFSAGLVFAGMLRYDKLKSLCIPSDVQSLSYGQALNLQKQFPIINVEPAIAAPGPDDSKAYAASADVINQMVAAEPEARPGSETVYKVLLEAMNQVERQFTEVKVERDISDRYLNAAAALQAHAKQHPHTLLKQCTSSDGDKDWENDGDKDTSDDGDASDGVDDSRDLSELRRKNERPALLFGHESGTHLAPTELRPAEFPDVLDSDGFTEKKEARAQQIYWAMTGDVGLNQVEPGSRGQNQIKTGSQGRNQMEVGRQGQNQMEAGSQNRTQMEGGSQTPNQRGNGNRHGLSRMEAGGQTSGQSSNQREDGGQRVNLRGGGGQSLNQRGGGGQGLIQRGGDGQGLNQRGGGGQGLIQRRDGGQGLIQREGGGKTIHQRMPAQKEAGDQGSNKKGDGGQIRNQECGGQGQHQSEAGNDSFNQRQTGTHTQHLMGAIGQGLSHGARARQSHGPVDTLWDSQRTAMSMLPNRVRNSSSAHFLGLTATPSPWSPSAIVVRKRPEDELVSLWNYKLKDLQRKGKFWDAILVMKSIRMSEKDPLPENSPEYSQGLVLAESAISPDMVHSIKEAFPKEAIVRVIKDSRKMASVQQQTNLFHRNMEEECGRKAVVHGVDKDGLVLVLMAFTNRWYFFDHRLIYRVRVNPPASLGWSDLMLVMHDEEVVRLLQDGYKGWIPQMKQCLGRVVTIESIQGDNLVEIKYLGHYRWKVNFNILSFIAKADECLSNYEPPAREDELWRPNLTDLVPFPQNRREVASAARSHPTISHGPFHELEFGSEADFRTLTLSADDYTHREPAMLLKAAPSSYSLGLSSNLRDRAGPDGPNSSDSQNIPPQ